MSNLEGTIVAEVNIERSYLNDKKYGSENEIIVEQQIKAFFNDYEMEKTKNRYCAYDFESPKMKYELKSRRCLFSKYPTTIIPVHKTKNVDKLCLIFKFTDGLYYIYYEEGLFKNFKQRNIAVFRDGCWGKAVPHFEIPTFLLLKIEI